MEDKPYEVKFLGVVLGTALNYEFDDMIGVASICSLNPAPGFEAIAGNVDIDLEDGTYEVCDEHGYLLSRGDFKPLLMAQLNK